MRLANNRLVTALTGDPGVRTVVPSIGLTSWLTVFVSASMAFLAVLALALALTTERVAQAWSEDIQRAATVRVTSPTGDASARTATVVQILQRTPGILSAQVLGQDAQRALLEPWLGGDVDLDQLPIPQLIEIVTDPAVFDKDDLTSRLSDEAPGAFLDDHARWREPLVAAAKRVRLLGQATLVLIAGAMAALVTLAAKASLSANSQVIKVLRLVGARDRFVAHAFVRRVTLRTLAGAFAGTLIGAILVVLVPPTAVETGLMADFGFKGSDWLWVLLIAPLAGTIAFASALLAARTTLRKTG